MSMSPSPSLTIHLCGHLTESSLARQLAPLTAYLGCLEQVPVGVGLLVDCSQMTGYDGAARALFVDWNARYRDRISSVAIVTDNKLWHMVIATMAMLSRQLMRPFQSEAEALAWLRRPQDKTRPSLPPRSRPVASAALRPPV